MGLPEPMKGLIIFLKLKESDNLLISYISKK